MSGRSEWRGTAFACWALGGVALLFLLRHPLGHTLLAGPSGGAVLAGALLPFFLGWTLGWTSRPRLVGLGLSVGLAALAALLRAGSTVVLALAGAILALPYLLGGVVAGRKLPRLRLPRLSAHPSQAGPGRAEEASAGLPPWGRWELPPGVPRAVPAGQDVVPLPAGEGPSAGPLTLPDGMGAVATPAAGAQVVEEDQVGRLDPAVLLAQTVLAVLEQGGAGAVPLHLEGGPGGVTLDLQFAGRRAGRAISALRHEIEAAVGAPYGESLYGEALRLSFPAHARGGTARTARDMLWVPLGRTAAGRRAFANLPAVGPLFLVGEDEGAIVAAVHTIAGTALCGALGGPPALLLAEEAGCYLDLYAEVAALHRGAGAMDALRALAFERDRRRESTPPILAVVLFPSPGAQEQLAHWITILVPAGVYPVVAVDTPRLWATQKLVGAGRARLVFAVGEAESRFFLGRTGAESLGDYQAVYHLAESLREPQLLQTYAVDEGEVQALLASQAGPGSAPREEETLTTEQALPEKVLAVLDAVLALGRYSVRQVWDRVRERRVSRQAVLELEDTFEAAGVVQVPTNPLGRRKVLTGSREEAVARLRAYLEETR